MSLKYPFLTPAIRILLRRAGREIIICTMCVHTYVRA